MRILCSNQVTESQTNYIAPRGKNPIHIGSDATCDVRLSAGTVPGVAATILNRGDGIGWQMQAKCDRIEISGSFLSVDSTLKLGSKTAFTIYPFSIIVYEDQSENVDSLETAYKQLDQKYSQFALQVHHRVMRRLQSVIGDPSTSTFNSSAESEASLLELENAIENEANLSEDFPKDGLFSTLLADHMAALNCRSRVLNAVIERINRESTRGSAPANKDRRFWSTLRSMRTDQEEVASKLTAGVIRRLELEELRDLSGAVRILDSSFRSVWGNIVKKIQMETRRYLALAHLKKEIKDNWYGYGPLEDLLDDPNVTEIMVNDADHIFIEKNGLIEDSGRRFLKGVTNNEGDRLLNTIERIVREVNRRIDTATPMVDARLPDGSRINAVISPLTVGGPVLTIRRFPAAPLSWNWLVETGSATKAAMEFLKAAVGIRTNILVAGGTASGKTTLLNALSAFIGDRERIITIEDTAELQLRNRHVVPLETRPKNIEGAGEISIRTLLKNALRMRPDRIIVGECRGGEALDMLQAMNTGHDGSMTTVHANSPADVISRLEVMVQQNEGNQLPVDSIHRQIASAVHLIVQLSAELVRVPETNEVRRRRHVSEISEVVSVDKENGGVIIKPLFQRRAHGELRPTGRLPSFIDRLVANGFNLVHLKTLN